MDAAKEWQESGFPRLTQQKPPGLLTEPRWHAPSTAPAGNKATNVIESVC